MFGLKEKKEQIKKNKEELRKKEIESLKKLKEERPHGFITKAFEHGTVKLAPEIVEKIGIKDGTSLHLEVKDGKIIISKIPRS